VDIYLILGAIWITQICSNQNAQLAEIRGDVERKFGLICSKFEWMSKNNYWRASPCDISSEIHLSLALINVESTGKKMDLRLDAEDLVFDYEMVSEAWPYPLQLEDDDDPQAYENLSISWLFSETDVRVDQIPDESSSEVISSNNSGSNQEVQLMDPNFIDEEIEGG